MNKMNNYDHSLYNMSEAILASKIAAILWIIVVYGGAMVLQRIEKPLILQSIFFTLAIAIYTIFHLFPNLFTDNRRWFYFLVQGVLIFTAAFLLPKGSPIILIGLLPVLVAQSFTFFQNKLKIAIIFIIFYCLYCIVIELNYGLQEMPIFILIFFFNMTIVSFFAVIYNRQVNARLRMEYYLYELEEAHQKVEKLTLANERQRMARDLHDTLAQGLAGLIMQLEAADAYLQNGNTNRSQEIIQQSMIRARETLRDARTAIDNLRANAIEETDFYHEVLKKIKQFTDATSIKAEYDVEPIFQLSNLTIEHSLYIISECLTNVAKHAQAQKVILVIKKINNHLMIEIKDDGIGFKTKSIGQHSGKYGLLGLNERVRLLGGKIEINSIPGRETKITVMVPI